MIGVAVVGLGVGREHALAYRRLPTCTLRALCDRDSSRLEEEVRALGGGVRGATWESILQDRSIQLVSLASYDHHHFEQVVAALRAGKHVFVEKPLCRSLEELRTVEQVWRESSGLHLSSNLVLRAAPLYRWIGEQRRSGRLGRLYAFDGDYLYGRIQKITEGWRREVPDYSVMQGGGVHLVDLMLGLTGERPAAVTAVGNRICTEGTAFRYRDFVAATFEFPSGLVGRITANFGCVHRHQHVVRVFGTEATVLYDDQGPRLHESRDPGVVPTALSHSPHPGTKGDLIPDFVQKIETEVDTRGDTQREFDLIRACLAADEALARSARVEISYP